jgi:hypothetical protein
MRHLITLLITGCLLSGCALFQANPLADQIVIQELTAVAIQAGCSTTATQTAQQCYDARAAHVLAIANSLKTVTVGQASSDIQTLLNGALAQLKLTPEEVAPITAFVSALISYVSSTFGTGILAQAAITQIQTVAGWVAAEAALY